MGARGFNQCAEPLVKVKCDFKLGLLMVVLLSLVNVNESSPPFGRRSEEWRQLSYFEDNYPVLPVGRHHRHRHRTERPKSVFEPLNEVPQQKLDFFEKPDQTTITTLVILPDGIRVINEDVESADSNSGKNFSPEINVASSPPNIPHNNPGGIILKGFDIPGEGKKPSPTTVPSSADQLCPTGQGFHQETGRCYNFVTIPRSAVAIPTPCGELMDFYRNPANKSLGVCDCREAVGRYGVRPLAFWKHTSRCYFLFDQGPCFENEWFILTDEGLPACRRRTCPQNDPKNYTMPANPIEDKSPFWFRERGKCYQTRSTNYCNKGNFQVVFENNPDTGFILTCADPTVIDAIQTRFLTNTIKDLPCKPGYSRTVNGQCSRTGSFE